MIITTAKVRKFLPVDVYKRQAGTHWLIYGSWHSGIAAVKVNPETGKVDALEGANPPAPWALSGQYTVNNYGKRIASRAPNNRWQGSEGPEIVKRGDYYYLFLAYGALDVEYNTRVVRSEKMCIRDRL